MPVRVIRVLEYEYPDHEAAERDMQNWGIPANGTKFGPVRSGWAKIRSATTFPAMVSESMPQEVPEPPRVMLDALRMVFAPEHDEPARVKLGKGEMATINNWINLVTGQGGIRDLT